MLSKLVYLLLATGSNDHGVINGGAPVSNVKIGIADTPLGTPAGAALLDGLDVFEVPSSNDGHPLSVYGIHSEGQTLDAGRRPVLLLHGRTWSAIPVYHLLGGPKNAAKNEPGRASRSFIEELYDSGVQPYTFDFRGFGGTPHDSNGCVEPNVCVHDTEDVLRFIASRHGLDKSHANPDMALEHDEMPVLLGWSQGALVAQLMAQKSPDLISKLILYGSIYDPLVRYPRAPLYTSGSAPKVMEPVENTFDGAIEDFTVEGTIPPEPARLFAEAGLTSDPIKAQWTHLYHFNNCDPARVQVPTLVVAGDQDPYAPLRVQSDLFFNLGRGADRTWSIMSNADHAVHLLDGRHRFLKLVTAFAQNSMNDNCRIP
eukprot:scaffold66295_cov43-Attheya_sp.AAC.3